MLVSRYQEHWRNMTQRYCFLIALTIWLETGILATHETVAEVLGSKWHLLLNYIITAGKTNISNEPKFSSIDSPRFY